MCGRQFYAVPTHLLPNLVPLRIDVFIPDQEQYPQDLRTNLHSSFSVCMRHPRLEHLGISGHLCRALDHYCGQNSDFLRDYQKLPFGSKLVFENISADVKAMSLTVVPAHDLERQLLSVASLQKLWQQQIPPHSWPKIIDLECMILKRQLHDSISLVGIQDKSACPSNEDLIFKSSTNGPKFIYHELKFLLSNPPHKNVMDRPLYVVTKKSNFGGKHGVCGFILPFYPLGSIRDILPYRALSGTLKPRQQFEWSRQLVSALIHIRDVTGTFYSDLRPDNVLLSGSAGDKSQNIILCDFEQRGNWHEWCAPEVLYGMYAENLRASPSSVDFSNVPQNLVDAYWRNNVFRIQSKRKDLRFGPHGSNSAWFSLSPQSQEKAQVYTLGLLLYCVFEGVSNVRVSLANAWPYEPDIEFPEFRRTPLLMQELIRRCTIDAPEWEHEQDGAARGVHKCPLGLTRLDGRLYPRGQAFSYVGSSDAVEAVLEATQAWWEREVERARKFFESDDWQTDNIGGNRPTLREVLAMLDNIETMDRGD